MGFLVFFSGMISPAKCVGEFYQRSSTQLAIWVDLILVELNSICLEDVGTSQYFMLHMSPIYVSFT